MNNREQKNEERKFIEKDGKKEDKINEKQKASIEIVNDKEFREENLENIDESEAKRNLIDRLDYDCLAKILSYVPPVDRPEMEKVCEKWEEAVAMSWHSVKKLDPKNLPIFIHKNESTLKELLNNCCKYLTHLTIDYQYSWMADVLKNNCKNIISFDVKLKLSEHFHSLCEIIVSMTKLKILKATTIREEYEFPDLWNKLIEILPADIEEIHLFKFKIYYLSENEQKCTLVLDKFTNLRCLTLRDLHLTTATIESILPKKNSLVYLDLYGCYLPEECPKIFTKLVNLEHLNLHGRVENLKDNIITEIAHNCHKLKYLSVDRCSSIQRSIFSELKYLNNLEHLEFPIVYGSRNDDNLISDVVDNCKKLKYFDVGRGENFLISDFETITKLNNLQYLNFHSAIIGSQSFINIVNNCLELKVFNVCLDNISDIALERLTNLKKFEKLDLNRRENLTGNLLSKIVNNCENLVDLNLYGCYNVTEDSLIKVGKLDNLKILDISGIRNIPSAMFDYFRKLEELKCKYCLSVTDEVVIKVIDNCIKLSNLELLGTGITFDTLFHAEERKFPYKFLNISINSFLHRDYLKLNRKPSHYLNINY